jgi:hypothetical protein
MKPCRLPGGLSTFQRNPILAFSVKKKVEAGFFEIRDSRRNLCTSRIPEESVCILIALKTSIFIVSENISAFEVKSHVQL